MPMPHSNKHTITCLNCGSPVAGNYCNTCGQAASTHRFSLKHIARDFARVVHVHQGIFFTLKELAIRPGHSIREFVEGKRVNHINYVTLLILTVILLSTIQAATDFHMTDLTDEKELLAPVDKLRTEHPKSFTIILIPYFSVFTFLFFRKAHQTFAEHIVLNTYRSAATMIINDAMMSIKFFTSNTLILREANTIAAVVITAYSTWFYYQFFSVFGYHKFGLFARSFLGCLVLPTVLVSVLLLLLYGN